MSAIFISHSSKDNKFCEKLIGWLAEQGHRSVFLDFDESTGIAAGQDWEQTLYRELRTCRAMIVVCTGNLMASKWCFAEITQARSLGKPIFPIKIEQCNIDSILLDSQVVDFVKDNDSDAFNRLKNGLIKAGVDAKDPYDWDGSRPPYPGLLAFQEEDAAIFFGRDKEIGIALDTLTSTYRYGGSGLVMTLGASGSGKSSLVRAGLIPRLKRDPERWLVLKPMRPSNDPIRELAKVLKSAFLEYANQNCAIQDLYDQLVIEELQQETDIASKNNLQETENELAFKIQSGKSSLSSKGLLNFIGELREASNRDNASVLLIIDQFEELLDRTNEHKASQFLFLIRTLLQEKGGKLICLGTMRSDFLGSFQQNPTLYGLDFGKILLGPIDKVSLTEIIEKPAELAGLKIEPKLLNALIEDTGKDDALPLLAFTLRELYDKYSGDNLMEYKEYKDFLGGIQGAIAKAAENILTHATLSNQKMEELRKAFLFMARMKEDGQFARNVAKWSDVPTEVHDVLNRFVDGRLLVSRGSENNEGTIEVAHEAIFRSWKRLKKWLNEEQEFFLWKRRLQVALEEWEYTKRDKNTLLDGPMLHEAANWIKGHQNQLNKEERNFILKSKKATSRRNLRRRISIIGIVTVITILGAFMAVGFINANKEYNRAQANYITSEAIKIAESNPNIALRMVSEALNIYQNSSLIEEAHQIYRENNFFRLITKFDTIVNRSFTNSNPYVTNSISTLEISPSSENILVGFKNGNISLIDLNGSTLREYQGHTGVAKSFIFFKDGTKFMSIIEDRIILWNISGKIQNIIKGYEQTYQPTRTVYGRRDNQNKYNYDNDKGPPFIYLPGSGDNIINVELSMDEKLIYTCSMKGMIRHWNLNGEKVFEAKANIKSLINYMTFINEDGTRFIYSTQDGKTTIFDLNEDIDSNVIIQRDKIYFSPNKEKWVHLSSNKLELYAVRYNNQKYHILKEGEYKVDVTNYFYRSANQVVFTPENSTIISSFSGNMNAQIWNPTRYVEFLPSELKGHSSEIANILVSPQNDYILTLERNGDLKYWPNKEPIWQFDTTYGTETTGSLFEFTYDNKFILDREANEAGILNFKICEIGQKCKLKKEFEEVPTTLYELKLDNKEALIVGIGKNLNENNIHMFQWDIDGKLLFKKEIEGITLPRYFQQNSRLVIDTNHKLIFIKNFENERMNIYNFQGQKVNSFELPIAPERSNIEFSISQNKDYIYYIQNYNYNDQLSYSRLRKSYNDQNAYIFDFKGQLIKKLIKVGSVKFSNYGSYFIKIDDENILMLSSISGRTKFKMKLTYLVKDLVFSPDNRHFLIHTSENKVLLYDFDGDLIKELTNKSIIRTYFSHNGELIICDNNESSNIFDLEGYNIYNVIPNTIGNLGQWSTSVISENSHLLFTYSASGVGMIWKLPISFKTLHETNKIIPLSTKEKKGLRLNF